MVPLSVLDLATITRGSDASVAFRNTLDLAQHAEAWGYRRYWLAEHHNMPGIASAATAVLIGYVAGGTKSIRVGSGGVIGAGGASETEIDAAWKEGFERAELFRNLERRVIGQHDPARPHADRLRARRHMRDHHRCRGRGDTRHVVMLGQPEAFVAPALGMLGEVESVVKGLGRGAAFDDRRQVEY